MKNKVGNTDLVKTIILQSAHSLSLHQKTTFSLSAKSKQCTMEEFWQKSKEKNILFDIIPPLIVCAILHLHIFFGICAKLEYL